MSKARVLLHVPGQMLPGGGESLPPFYQRLLEGLAARGAKVAVLHRDMEALRHGPRGQDFDFIYNGNVDRAQALNVGPAYLNRFHYADPKGIFADSSMVERRFRPEVMPAEKAREFTLKLRKIFVETRRSRHLQPEKIEDYGKGHIAVFLQDISDPVLRFRHMTARQMLEGLLATGRPLLVKPHPRNPGEETDQLLDWLHRDHAGQVRLTAANVHDMLPGAIATASIGSSVALEGMLYQVPALLFGRSDLHHCAVSITEPQKTGAGLQMALTKAWPFEAFLFWFLRRHMIWATRPFIDDILRRMSAQGADFNALGLRSESLL